MLGTVDMKHERRQNTLSHSDTRHAEPSEKLLRELVHETLDLVFIKDSEGRYLVANPASALVAGRPVDEILGHTDEEVFPPEQAHQLREVDQRILASGQSETYDETFVVDGEIRHFSTAKTPARDDDGAPLGIIGISRDITDRKRTEEALARMALENQSLLEGARAEKGWLATILERTPMPLVFVEPGTARLFFANAAADRMAGGLPRPVTVAEHQRCFDMRGVDGRPLTADEMPLVRAARGEELNGFQFCWTFPNGAARTLVAYSARLPAVHGHAETVMLAFDDITALKQTQGELQEAVRVRQDFLSVAGHELKTPLTAILLNVRVLDRALGSVFRHAITAANRPAPGRSLAGPAASDRALDRSGRAAAGCLAHLRGKADAGSRAAGSRGGCARSREPVLGSGIPADHDRRARPHSWSLGSAARRAGDHEPDIQRCHLR